MGKQYDLQRLQLMLQHSVEILKKSEACIDENKVIDTVNEFSGGPELVAKFTPEELSAEAESAIKTWWDECPCPMPSPAHDWPPPSPWPPERYPETEQE